MRCQVFELVGVGARQLFGADGCDRRRHIQQPLGPLVRGDDNIAVGPGLGTRTGLRLSARGGGHHDRHRHAAQEHAAGCCNAATPRTFRIDHEVGHVRPLCCAAAFTCWRHRRRVDLQFRDNPSYLMHPLAASRAGTDQSASSNTISWAPSQSALRPSSGSCSSPSIIDIKWLAASWPSLLAKRTPP